MEKNVVEVGRIFLVTDDGTVPRPLNIKQISLLRLEPCHIANDKASIVDKTYLLFRL